MIEIQRTVLVQETRSAFQHAMQEKFIAAVERLSGGACSRSSPTTTSAPTWRSSSSCSSPCRASCRSGRRTPERMVAMAAAHSRIARRSQRLVLATARTPLRHLWALGYRVVAHAVGRVLSRGEPGAAVYTRASLGGREFIARPLRRRPGDRARDRRAGRPGARALASGSTRGLPSAGWSTCRSSTGRRSCAALAGTSALTYDGVGLRRAAGDARRRADAAAARARRREDRAPGSQLRGPDRRPPQRPVRRPGAADRSLVRAGLLVALRVPGLRRPARPVAGQPLREARGRAGADLARAGARRAARARARTLLRLLLRRLPEEEAALRATIELERDAATAPPSRRSPR